MSNLSCAVKPALKPSVSYFEKLGCLPTLKNYDD